MEAGSIDNIIEMPSKLYLPFAELTGKLQDEDATNIANNDVYTAI